MLCIICLFTFKPDGKLDFLAFNFQVPLIIDILFQKIFRFAVKTHPLALQIDYLYRLLGLFLARSKLAPSQRKG
jgi:hypothetical protein